MASLTHITESGDAIMVDVSDKAMSSREAVASGFVQLSPQTIQVMRDNNIPKGDVLATARIAGILACKRTSDLIPLCHPLPISKVTVDLEIRETGIAITALVKVTGQTGVEMEALTAVSVAALTVYDMVKAIDREAIITDIRLEKKSGGKSGSYERENSQ